MTTVTTDIRVFLTSNIRFASENWLPPIFAYFCFPVYPFPKKSIFTSNLTYWHIVTVETCVVVSHEATAVLRVKDQNSLIKLARKFDLFTPTANKFLRYLSHYTQKTNVQILLRSRLYQRTQASSVVQLWVLGYLVIFLLSMKFLYLPEKFLFKGTLILYTE